MSFVHEDRDFQQLIGIVARDTGIAGALIEKDYWVTHTLWALHETGLDLWFKGGTSLSKGFGRRASAPPRCGGQARGGRASLWEHRADVLGSPDPAR